MDNANFGVDMGSEANMNRTASSGSVSHLLFVLQQTKAEIMEDMRTRFATLNESISQKIEESAGRAVEQMLEGLPDTWGAQRWDDSRQSDRSGMSKPPLQLKYLNKLAEKEKASVPLLQWFLMATVVSFTSAERNSRAWVQEDVYRRISENLRAITGASGMSCLFFAVANTDGKEKYQSPIGRFWTFIMRSAIVSILMHAKQHSFCTAESATQDISPNTRRIPAWLSAFGNKKKTAAVVNLFVDKAEYKADVSSSECSGDVDENARKRRRLEKDEDQAENRGAAVQVLRKSMMRLLTYGRTEVRAHLFEHLLFLVEKIDSFSSVEAAREAGFEVIFQNGSAEEVSVCASENLPGSIWDIPNARVTTVREARQKGSALDDSALLDENRKHLNDLQVHFPSLTVIMRYKKNVKPESQGTDIGSRGRAGQDAHVMWPVEEYVSLHRVATGCLIGAFRGRDANMVLSSGSLSLKAIHVLAIALRGLLRQCVGLPLSTMEATALGDVTHRSVKKGEKKVTAMMGTDVTARKKRVKEIRDHKFIMTWAAYVLEKEKLEEEERRRGERTMLSDPSGEEDGDDDDEEWMNMEGAVRCT